VAEARKRARTLMLKFAMRREGLASGEGVGVNTAGDPLLCAWV
jgi:hypothetical protein